MAQSGSSRGFLWLCAHWFCSIGALGILYPYFALFLRENVGLSSTQVGLVLAVQPVVGLFAQPAWGHVADRTGSRLGVLVILGAGTAVGFFALAHAADLASVLISSTLLALFITALTPLSVSVGFAAVLTARRFGRARVWGTLGYLLVVVAVPIALRMRREALGVTVVAGGPSEPGLELMFYGGAALALAGAVFALGLRNQPGLSQRAQRGDFRALLAMPSFMRVLLFTTGIQLFVSAPMQFFPLYVRARGGSMTDVSHMWIWMLLFEAPLIFFSGRLFERFGVARVMIAAAAGGGLRWIVCACVPTLAYVYPVQVMHALVVTGLGVGTALHVEQIVPARLRSTGQALVVMVGSSIGGVASSVLGGAIVDRFGIDPLYFGYGAGAMLWAAAWWRSLGHAVKPLTPAGAAG